MGGEFAPARAQTLADQVPPPAPLPAGPLALDVEHAAAAGATVTLVDGRQLRGRVLHYAPGDQLVLQQEGQSVVLGWAELRQVQFDPVPLPELPPGSASPRTREQAAPLQVDPMREEELTRLITKRKLLLASNRRWGPAAAGLGVGVASIFVGAFLIAGANGGPISDCGPGCPSPFNIRQWRTGVALSTLGSLLFVVSVPMLIVRASRDARLKRVDGHIARLERTLSLSPLVTPSGHAGVAARASF